MILGCCLLSLPVSVCDSRILVVVQKDLVSGQTGGHQPDGGHDLRQSEVARAYVYEDGLRGVRPAGPPDTVADDTVWYLLNPGIHIVYGKS